MQVRARQFVCKATFTKFISGCSQYSAIPTKVRAKLGLKAYKTSKSPFRLNYNRKFLLEKQSLKNNEGWK